MQLTPTQEEAVNYSGDAAIIAAPGSGKTTVLVEKAARLIETGNKILLVTFTDRAGMELKNRLAHRLKTDEPAALIGTIHSCLAQILKTHGPEIGVSDFEVLEEALANLQRVRTCRASLLRLLGDRDPEAIVFAKQFGFHAAVRAGAELLALRTTNAATYGALLTSLQEDFSQQKRKSNRLDFHDLEVLGLKLLQQPKVRSEPDMQRDWILVDEFQDISRTQWEILSLLYQPTRNHLVIVGDPRQSIYRFRGARPDLFWEVSRLLGKTFHLDENFRSRPSLIDFVNRLTPLLFPDFPRPIKSTRSAAAENGVEFISLEALSSVDEQRTLEAKMVTQKIIRCHEAGIEWEKIALLFRTRRAMPYFEEQFKAAKIPFETVAGEPLLERPEVLALLFALRHFLDPNDLTAKLGFACSPLKELSAEEKRNLAEFEKLILRLCAFEPTDLSGLVQTIQVLRDEEARIPCPEPGNPQGVRLLTVHAAKGLEFPTVFLCDLTARPSRSPLPFLSDEQGTLHFKEGSEFFLELEQQDRAAELQESKRLLYVAMTRAKERLILPLPAASKRTKESWSEFLTDLHPIKISI